MYSYQLCHLLLKNCPAIQQASASPIRVVVVTSHQEVSTPGFISPNYGVTNPDVAQMMHSGTYRQSGTVHHSHAHFCGRMRAKALEISNAFRKALGMSPIETETPATTDSNTVHILPFIGTPLPTPSAVPVTGFKGAEMSDEREPDMRMTHHRPARLRMKCHRPSFMRRVHRALMTLGPWEGRAVAFVLGCGIGVILRMFWVMAIVTARLFKGKKEEYEYDIVFEQDAEDILVPPPQYTDEKVEAVDIKIAPAAQT
ncbi:hypothetical protein JAAARDRAFT_37052 [Jaapia argillacea MUCL 33604]|uniref:Uncharacterized protein n=1 Tax=Jaapia argillacea MUCL 33604 TaxID=933084 RepID=A0A067PL78_9AGAM|nr:hypothetical protein JAAARDRAFT_37052 [Jaapia argillacea MUCL 33604]